MAVDQRPKPTNCASITQEILEELSAQFASFMSRPLPSELAAAQQKGFVTYTAPQSMPNPFAVCMLEAPSLLASSGTTGFRTWAAALHLGAFLVSPVGSELVRGRSILELGAGTGFVSVLCAKFLQAKNVLATDGSLAVIADLQSNVALNSLESTQKVEVKQLVWGHSLVGGPVDTRDSGNTFDLAIGADVVSGP